MTALCDLVFATSNQGKLEEVRQMLASLPLAIRGLRDVLHVAPRIIEDGATFEANAAKKALVIASATQMLTLADDSGLEVDILDGRPGVRSARFAGDNATDAENKVALVREIEALLARRPNNDKSPISARFRCALALVDPFVGGGSPVIVNGRCEGTITLTARGSNGFGYDPLFVVDGLNQTMAELSESEKNRVSHRGRAVEQLVPKLERILSHRLGRVTELERRPR